MDNTELARIAYDAYRDHTGGVSLATGQPIPEWPHLRPEIQAAWQASAEAVREPIDTVWNETYDRDREKINALRAHVERMRAACRKLRNEAHGLCIAELEIREAVGNTNWECLQLRIREAELALAATPAQSLASVKAAALREVANLIRQTTPEPVDAVPESFGAHQGRMYAIEQIESEAARIEKEGA